jgi:UDP-N-acetylmuramyl pentapeptide phosphotransferase/UDP-N-acetylglucosamine-1-phosphate transferase
MSLLLVAFFILFIVGFTDDLKGLSPRVKFAGQVLAAFMVAYSGLRIESLYGIFGVYDIPLIIQYAFTIFLVAGIVNAVNLIDGIDGLAGGLSFIGALFLSWLMASYGDGDFALVGLSLAGALLAFLRFNFHPAKIFMGDTGSILLGFALAILGIRLISFADNTIDMADHSSVVILVFGALLVPVYDTLRVFAGRVARRQSPFQPDKTHIHHLLIQCGYNHARAAAILYSANIILIISAYMLRHENPGLVVFLLLAEAILLTEFLTIRKIFLSLAIRKKARREIAKIRNSNRFIIQHFNDKA